MEAFAQGIVEGLDIVLVGQVLLLELLRLRFVAVKDWQHGVLAPFLHLFQLLWQQLAMGRCTRASVVWNHLSSCS